MAQETSVNNFEMVRTSHFPHIMHDLGAFPPSLQSEIRNVLYNGLDKRGN